MACVELIRIKQMGLVECVIYSKLCQNYMKVPVV